MARVWNTPIFAIATVYFTVDALLSPNTRFISSVSDVLPSSAAPINNSSALETSRRNEKWVVTWSSA
jgi:hypothetical protein